MIEWNGGECPVEPKAHIAVLLRNGDTLVGFGADYIWTHNSSGGDIVAYLRLDR